MHAIEIDLGTGYMAEGMTDEEKLILEVTGKIPMTQTKSKNSIYDGKMSTTEFFAIGVIGVALEVFIALKESQLSDLNALGLLSGILSVSCIFSFFMVRKAITVSAFTRIFVFTIPGFIDFFMIFNLVPIVFSPFNALIGAVGIFIAYFVLNRNGIFG